MSVKGSCIKSLKILIPLTIVLIIAGLGWKDYRRSQVVGSPYRFNMVVLGERAQVSFLSFDPEEKQIFVLPFPNNLEIKSRSVGTYRIDNLYRLGSYEGEAGAFVRRKVQGFMRVPVAGYLTMDKEKKSLKDTLRAGLFHAFIGNTHTSLSRSDAFILMTKLSRYEWREASESELVRGGVISQEGDSFAYDQERLKQYLGARVFDWAVGGTNATVAVVNATEERELGADVAEFLSNLGFEVVSVKSQEGAKQEKTTLVYEGGKPQETREVINFLTDLFGWEDIREGNTSEARADLVITLGTDAIQLF